MKLMTLTEAETKRRKAVEFLRRIGKDDLAEEFEAMTPEGYAQRKGAELIRNPRRRMRIMARKKSVAQLEAEIADLRDEIADLEEENEDLQSTLSEIGALVSGEEEEEDEEDDDLGE